MIAAGVLSTSGCSRKGPPPPLVILGVMDLPVSLRNGDAAPTDYHKVEIGLSDARIDDAKTFKLPDGKFAASDLPGLNAALANPVRSRLTLEMHASALYDAVLTVLEAAAKSGIKEAAIKVRKPGGSATTGWLAIKNFKVIPPTEDEVTFETVAPREWNDFVAIWDRVFAGCNGSDASFCRIKPQKIAAGGHMQIVLFSAGHGLNITFKRVGAPPPPEPEPVPIPGLLTEKEKKKPKKVEIPKDLPPELADRMSPEQIEEWKQTPYAVEATYQYRSNDGVTLPSPISATVAPVCGQSACGVVVICRNDTFTVWVVALLGAAFPDGTAAPEVVFMK